MMNFSLITLDLHSVIEKNLLSEEKNWCDWRSLEPQCHWNDDLFELLVKHFTCCWLECDWYVLKVIDISLWTPCFCRKASFGSVLFEDLRTTGHQTMLFLTWYVCVCVPHGFKLWLYVPCIPTPHSGFISNNFCSSCWVCSPKCSDNFGRNPPTMVQTLRLVVCSLSKNWYWKGLLPRKLTWLAGKSTRNEDVFPIFNGEFSS